MNLIILSGRSGSGKSTALRTLEDAGFRCIDNLPVSLLEPLMLAHRNSLQAKELDLGVCIDARSGDLDKFPEILARLKLEDVNIQIIYLDAHSPTLVKRFSETRRRHPLTSADVDLQQGVDMEARILASVADLATLTLNTTEISDKELSQLIIDRVLERQDSSISLLFRSFGYKRGVPVDADFVFDLRCLPNPHWEISLRPLTGLHAEVAAYLGNQPRVLDMLEEISSALSLWVPRFVDHDSMYMTIALGCTGGQHRSVFFAEQLATRFTANYDNVLVRHRELARNTRVKD